MPPRLLPNEHLLTKAERTRFRRWLTRTEVDVDHMNAHIDPDGSMCYTCPCPQQKIAAIIEARC